MLKNIRCGMDKTNMKHKLFFTLLLVGTSSLLQAQSDTLKNEVFGVFITAPIEFPIIDNREVNNELSELGYPKSNYAAANIGIGIQLHMNRFITALSFNKGTKRDDKESYLSEVEYRSLSFNLGFDLTKNYRYSIYPFAGIKAYEFSYLHQEKITSESSFENYFNTDLAYKEMSYSRMNLDLGIGFSYQWFFLLSIKAGYLLPLEGAEWNILNTQINLSNSPSMSYNYYFAFTIGLGNILSNKDLQNQFGTEEQL